MSRITVPSRSSAFTLAALTFLAAFTFALPAKAAVGCAVRHFRLANGLRVLICPTSVGSDVSVFVHYDVGARDEPGPLAGIAHLTEHLMFVGSRHVAPGDHVRLLDQIGATNLNGVTWMDRTAYFETVPPERLALALWLESDRMGYGEDRLDSRAVERERAAVLNELRDHVLDVPCGALPALLRNELFPAWHPYHHVVSGTPSSIARIQLDDVRAFRRTWYGPENATLAVVGPVDPGAVAALAQGYFGSLPAHPPPVRPTLPPLSPPPAEVVRVGANIVHPTVLIGWMTPPLRAAGDAELDIAAAILAGPSGWLRRRMGTMAINVNAVQRSSALASVFEIQAAVGTAFKVSDALSAIEDALSRFDAGVSAADLSRAQTTWYATKLFRLENVSSWPSSLVFTAQRQPSLSFFDGDLAMYSAITPDGVRAAVRTFLGRAHRVVVEVEPRPAEPVRGVLLERRQVAQ